MEFKEFKLALQRNYNEMLKSGPLFQLRLDKEFLWSLYLDSFPAGTNPMYRERTEHDCSACKSFVKHAGGLVTIEDGKLRSIWDIQGEGEYKVVADALADFVKQLEIENVFLYTEPHIGIDKNHEDTPSGIKVWEHLHVTLPKNVVVKGVDIGPKQGEYRAMHDVVLRSLKEITPEAIETVLDLISQNSLYRGEEKKKLITTFADMKKEFDKLGSDEAQDFYAWKQVVGDNAWVCKIRNDVIGTLLVEISEGESLEKAVKGYESKVAPANYKRPTALVTPKMRDQARQTIIDLGYMDSLERRYARLEDINVTNVLFADRGAKKRMGGDVFDDLPVAKTLPKLDKVEEVPIEKFLTEILPTARSLEVLVENRHVPNLVSLIAPADLTAKTMFKWGNGFSWSYNGDVADSDIRQRVVAKGGRVDGVFRFSHSWNHRKRNASLMDLHVFMPRSTKKVSNGINDDYGNDERVGWNRRNHYYSGGVQDVDYTAAAPVGYIPVENITFPDLGKLKDGKYECMIHNWSLRQPTEGGFQAEIEFEGQVFQYEYDKPMKNKEWVRVATATLSKGRWSIEHHLPTTTATQDKWSIKTQEFRPVTAVMLSPNHWDGEGVGNKHYFFMLDGCKNDGSARGFYNEFLSSELEPHRKTMELVGSKMRTDECDDQMSGLGFSSTQRNDVVVKVKGSFERMVKVVF